jgi:hypothetical protein
MAPHPDGANDLEPDAMSILNETTYFPKIDGETVRKFYLALSIGGTHGFVTVDSRTRWNFDPKKDETVPNKEYLVLFFYNPANCLTFRKLMRDLLSVDLQATLESVYLDSQHIDKVHGFLLENRPSASN